METLRGWRAAAQQGCGGTSEGHRNRAQGPPMTNSQEMPPVPYTSCLGLHPYLQGSAKKFRCPGP